jgi:two-component system, OmpR family, sensor histidine kinase KdpD
VVGWIESYGRLETSRQLGGLEVIAPRTVAYRGAVFADFDAHAVIASGADVVLVDELAHATADRTRQRWQDVADVLRAGHDVVTTVNVAHLRSAPTMRPGSPEWGACRACRMSSCAQARSC